MPGINKISVLRISMIYKHIRVSRGKISLALMPVNIVDYRSTPVD